MSWETFSIILRILVSKEYLEPLSRGSCLLSVFQFFLGFLLFLFPCLFLSLCLDFLKQNFLVLILPNWINSLSSIFKSNSKMRKNLISEFIAKHENFFGAIVCLFFKLISELRDSIYIRSYHLFLIKLLSFDHLWHYIIIVNSEDLKDSKDVLRRFPDQRRFNLWLILLKIWVSSSYQFRKMVYNSWSVEAVS